MNIFRITSMKFIPLVTMLVFSFGIEAKQLEKESKKVDAKCFVEIVGGGEMVSFWNVSQNKISSLSKSITGRKVMAPNSKQKVIIYKADECVLLKDNFTGSRAKIVDAKTAR
ncbi:MAG: hypothetical protein ACJAT7_003721 [Psychromonas sp.]|jgi:hypothetical protein|uniref:TapY2 family type IVa secretion system protein n=1 Tax=Psychromonas sp. TaxID=1884585 RepID=UPI0039E56E72